MVSRWNIYLQEAVGYKDIIIDSIIFIMKKVNSNLEMFAVVQAPFVFVEQIKLT